MPKNNNTNLTSLENTKFPKNVRFASVSFRSLFKEGFVAGLGWSVGVTIGFVIISTLLVFVFSQLDGLPVIGAWLADIVKETQDQLARRNPLYR
jgi:hypothetical protein